VKQVGPRGVALPVYGGGIGRFGRVHDGHEIQVSSQGEQEQEKYAGRPFQDFPEAAEQGVFLHEADC
jgi:hypothetical protein